MTDGSQFSERLKIWTAVVPAMVIPAVGSLFYFVLLSESAAAKTIYASTKVFNIVWPVAAVVWVIRGHLPKFRTFCFDRRTFLSGLIVGTAMAALLLALMATSLAQIVDSGAGNIREKIESLGILEHYWLFGLFLSIVHSLIEEYYWRWFLFGRLRQVLPSGAAHALAAAAFAAHHVIVAGQYFGWTWGIVAGFGVAAAGVVWSRLYQRQNTLAAAWISHILVDLAIIAIGHKVVFGTYF